MPTPSPTPSPSVAPLLDVLDQVQGNPIVSGVVTALFVGLITWAVGKVVKGHPFRAIGRGARTAWRWVRGLRLLVTAQAWEQQRAAGFAERSAEVEEERATVPRPSWGVMPARRLRSGEDGWTAYSLMNYGYVVQDVSLTAPPELFLFEREAFFRGDYGTDMPGGGTGSLFSGRVTDQGRLHGVRFEVAWRDRHGDTHKGTVDLPPQEGPVETPEAAYDRGRLEERAQTERRMRTAPDPRWLISATDDYDGTFHLENLVQPSEAWNVRVDPFGAGFRMLSAATWSQVDGGRRVVFHGEVLGPTLDTVQLKVSWTGTDGVERREFVHPKGPPGS